MVTQSQPVSTRLTTGTRRELRERDALAEIAAEAARAGQTWGPQTHLPDGTGPDVRWTVSTERAAADLADQFRLLCKQRAAAGIVEWLDILLEEVAEAFAEDDPARLRAELVQVAAVALRWITAIDTRDALARDKRRAQDERDAQMRREGALTLLGELAQCVSIDPRALDPWCARFGDGDTQTAEEADADA